jgi:hippurate hydrolase
MVTALQIAVTRAFDVFDPVVLSVGAFHAGTQRNIIPADAEFQATIRTFSAATAEKVRRVVTQVCTGIAAAHGVRAEIDYRDVYPATVTDPAAHAFVTGTVRELFGPDRWTDLADPFPASEDFSRVLQRVPGAYFFVGACTTGDPAGAPAIHSPSATFDDRLLDDCAELLAALALRARTVAS